jgi:hypothetical protein
VTIDLFHVIAVTAEKRLSSSPHPEESSLKRRRADYFNYFSDTAPSTLAQPSKFSKLQEDSAIRMFCNRPRTATSTPITLLHPIFGKFVDDCKDCLPTPDLACFALDLATEMCKFYKNEVDRAQAFRDLIWDQLEIKLDVTKVEGTEFSTDGHASPSIGSHVYVKNEIGSTAADPYLQSATHYHHHAKYSF